MINNFEHLSNEEFEELRRVFYTQAYEIIEDLQDEILRLDNTPEDENALKSIKRYVHTLKGDSNSFGLTSVGTLCHRVEDLLSSIMGGTDHADHKSIDLLLSCVDTINGLLLGSESGKDGGDIKGIIERIDLFISPSPIPLPSGERIEVRGAPFTEYQQLQIQDALKGGLNIYEIEISFHPMCGEKGIAQLMVSQRLNGMGQIIYSIPDIESSEIDETEKMTLLFSSKLTQEEIKRDAFITGITSEIDIKDNPPTSPFNKGGEEGDLEKGASPRSYQSWGERGFERAGQGVIKNETLRVDASKVDEMMNLAGELIIGRSMVEQVAKDLEDGVLIQDASTRLFAANSYMERTVTDIQKGIMKMRMVPISHVFRRFPKMVRELSSEKGKLVRLEIHGKETELDKGIIDFIGEPLSHIIRNSIDHGIENPARRRSTGKNEEGVIALKAYHESGQIFVEVSDDGKGIDIDGLKKKAVERGFLSEGDARRLSEGDAINLIFLSGLSISETVTETSGRGIGMDAVKSAVESMKGIIEVESIPGKGTRFILRLPLTLAIIKALLFDIGERLYAIPISAVSEVARIMSEDLTTVDGKDVLLFRDKIISIIHLRELFRIDGGRNRKRFVLILGIGEKRIGVLIDRLFGQQELVIKALDEDYGRSGLMAGASILGDGRVVLILDAPAIFKKAIEDEKAKFKVQNETLMPSTRHKET